MTRNRAALTLAIGAITLTGCGGGGGSGPGNVNLEYPVAVATAYYEAWFRCGEEGGGAQWDLRASNGISREKALSDDKERGCRPVKPPELVGNIAAEEGEQVLVSLRSPSDPDVDEKMVLVKQEDDWKVDDDGGKPEEAVS